MQSESFKRTYKNIKSHTLGKIRCGFGDIFLWVILMGNPWLLFPVAHIARHIYITNIIPWGWWKRKGTTDPDRDGMGRRYSLCALVLIYFVFAFIGQQYEIPSSSLEKISACR